ncbi:MAG: hypothetical protein KatS3mg129_1661 [Leptospiraceae bacterium]|nr:MAG: hypothetical protein KatS3mg129_1661 [Leptospiraceae bacterium]
MINKIELIFLDYFFHFLHLSIILWNLTGWLFKKYRKFHFLSLNIVFLFWFFVGYFYGFGYCPITEYHWKVKYKQGEEDLPNSYITYLLNQFKIYPEEQLVDFFVLIITLIIYILSMYLFIKDTRLKHK